jgi:hypothetical protein
VGTRTDRRVFDPVTVGNREADAWVAYHRHEWPRFLAAGVGMVLAGFGMPPLKSALGAWHVLRANQLWAPYPHNDPDGALTEMRRFYRLVARDLALPIDPARAAALEVEWWRLHRELQHESGLSDGPLVRALVDLYAYVYAAPPESMYDAARQRVTAMNLSDRWVAAGCRPDDPLLTQERLALVASYSALRDAVSRSQRAAPVASAASGFSARPRSARVPRAARGRRSSPRARSR